jgi:GntR family transcriptional regulator
MRVHAVPAFRPLYLQVRDVLEARLASGEWKPGEPIPAELALAARFNVSHGTVRKAIDSLAKDNLVVRRQGKGTFVATHTEEHASHFRFLRIRRDDGVDEYPESRIVDLRRARANAEVARELRLKGGDAIVLVRRLLLYQAAPTVLDEITLPGALFRGLTHALLDEHKASMYSLFETRFGVRMLKAREALRAVAADSGAAALLRVPTGTPLLAVDRVAYTYGDRPVELRRGLCTTRDHHYVNELF